MHQATPHGRHHVRRWAALALLTLLAAIGLSGCVRVQAGLAVSDEDTVSGTLVIASIAIRQNDTGPTLKVPTELGGKVKTEVYGADGYTGQKLTLQDLTFPEVALLAEKITNGKQYRLNFRRSGSLVTLAGSVDLSALPPDRAEVQIKISFPGTVSRTNGVNDNNTVSWSPKPGTVTEFNATSEYSGGQSGASWIKWVLIVGAAAIGVAVIVGLLALFSHRRTERTRSTV
ncbi:MAG: DUF3153 domain-containing protein [Actinomycetota bacterium]|nr:DUF3153 domain-containing protein [Actinomycetota bacterium]